MFSFRSKPVWSVSFIQTAYFIRSEPSIARTNLMNWVKLLIEVKEMTAKQESKYLKASKKLEEILVFHVAFHFSQHVEPVVHDLVDSRSVCQSRKQNMTAFRKLGVEMCENADDILAKDAIRGHVGDRVRESGEKIRLKAGV